MLIEKRRAEAAQIITGKQPAIFIFYLSFIYVFIYLRHTVAQLVEALCYNSEDRGFDSRCCSWNFSLT